MFAAFASAYAAFCMLGYLLSVGDPAVVVIWPAAGLLVAIIASTPRRLWPLWVVATFAGRLAAELLFLDNRSLQMAFGFGTASCIEALILGLFMQKPLQQAYRLSRPLYLIMAMLALAVAATFVGGLVGAAMVNLLQPELDAPFWLFWRVWVAGDFLGIIVVAPLLTRLFLPQIRIKSPAPGIPESLLLLASMVAAAFLPTLGLTEANEYAGTASLALALAMTAPMFWAGARFSFPVVVLAQSIFVVSSIIYASANVGPFAMNQGEFLPQLAQLQIYLCVSIVVVLLAAFIALERQRAIVEMRMHQGLGSVLITLTDKLVNAESNNFDESVQQVLREIAKFAQADRAILFEIDSVSQTISRTHRWTKPGVGQHSEKLLNADPKKFPWVLRQLRERGYIVFDNFNRKLPDGAEELREIQETSPTATAAVYMGLFSEGELSGIIGCGYASRGRSWDNESLSLMYLVGQLFSNVLIRKNAEGSLDLYRDKLRQLATEVALSEERARRQTAIDLHDGIGQNLAVARMKIGQLLVAGAQNKDELGQLRNLIDEALRGTRYIIADLSPSILYELGLVPALQSLVERFEIASDLNCNVTESGEPWQPDNDTNIGLYRAVQEFLNNTARHAQASNVDINIDWQNDYVDILVADDGIGFDVAEATTFREGQSGFGLFSVRESINLFGGTLKIDSALGLGTRVMICVPRREGDSQ